MPSVGQDLEELLPSYITGGMWKGKLFWKTVWQFFKRLNMYSSYNQTIPLPGDYSEKGEHIVTQDSHATFTAALFNAAESWKPKLETIQTSIGWWMDKQTLPIQWNTV